MKDGHKEVKRYGALYVCLSSRAIHIEVVYSLSTDSFIMILSRFVGCRGNVRMIRSDNGSNLVGASTELVCAFQEMNYIKIENLRRMVVSGSYGKETYHYQATWERFGNARFGVQEQL